MARARSLGAVPALLCVRPPPETSRLFLAVMALAAVATVVQAQANLRVTNTQEYSITVAWDGCPGSPPNCGSSVNNVSAELTQTSPTTIEGFPFGICSGNLPTQVYSCPNSWTAHSDRFGAVRVQPGREYAITIRFGYDGPSPGSDYISQSSASITVTAAGELVEDPETDDEEEDGDDPPTTGGGSPPTPAPEPEPEEENAGCEVWTTPYWRGSGGFAVRPTDRNSAVVRLRRGRTMRFPKREYAGDDGLIVRLIDDSLFFDRDGDPLAGTVSFEGIDGGGWYWVNGDRNVAVAPLVCESSFSDRIEPPIPGGVAASSSDTGTLVVHEGTGFMGVIPHLEALHGDGRHVASYWKGDGGVVGRALNGRSVAVRRACGIVPETYTVDAGEDGLVVELVDGCVDPRGNSIRSGLEVEGLADGAWYWLNENGLSAAAPLIRRSGDPAELAAPVIPGGVYADEGLRGTQFIRDRLMGVVPRLEAP